MSKQIDNPFVPRIDGNPTNLDLLTEQARQGALLESLRDDVKEIKEILVGSDKRQGVIMDIDRLKRSRALFHAVLWAVFIAAIGMAASVIASAIK